MTDQHDPPSNRVVWRYRWVSASAWGVFDPLVPKYIRAQVLGISMLWLMVAVAVQTQLKYPDLDCDQYTNEADCLVMASPFDPAIAACAWDPTIAPPCDTAPPDTSSQFTPINIALLVIVMLCIEPFIKVVEVRAQRGEREYEYRYSPPLQRRRGRCRRLRATVSRWRDHLSRRLQRAAPEAPLWPLRRAPARAAALGLGGGGAAPHEAGRRCGGRGQGGQGCS